MLRRLGIRAKVLAVLAVPVIVLIAAGVYISNTALQQLRSATAAVDAINVLDKYAPLSAALQTERDLSTASTRNVAALAAARTATDEAIADAKPYVEKLDVMQFSGNLTGSFTAAKTGYLVDLPSVRQRVDTVNQSEINAGKFNAIIASQLDLVGQLSQLLDNREVSSYLAAYHALGQTSESLVNERTLGLKVMQQNPPVAGDVQNFTIQVAETEFYRADLHRALDAIGNKKLTLSTSDPSSVVTAQRGLISSGSADSMQRVDQDAWRDNTQAQLRTLNALANDILSTATDKARTAQTEERSAAIVTVGSAAFAVFISVLLAFIVSRSIVIPLRRLTAATAEVREQLPSLVEQMAVPGEGPSLEIAQIPVTSFDEVGMLAASFNAVNATTLQIAQEQAALRGSIAEMFVNVARRDQVLLNRQLSFIDSLERTEEDPNALANLFRLDHLATRMRRNAESLLVLAGIDSGRRMRDAMPLSDVIRTASSEIEQYDRIQLDLPVDPHMHGFNALSSAHLIAEILENATVFSEPETPVEVSTGVRGEFVTVTVLDHGLGMSEEELSVANEKIRSVSATDAMGAQRLGLFVVGRLAQRLAARVELRKGVNGSGTVTVIEFPLTLFQATESNQLGYGLPQRMMPDEHPVVPVAPTVEEAAAAWLEPPVIHEEEPPVVEVIDLATLTDGATSLGLPKRRLRDDEGANTGSLPTQQDLRDREERKIVLPEIMEPHLELDFSDEVGGWTPDVAAPAGAALPARARAASSFWHDPSAEDETLVPEAPAVVPPEVRTGLFTGFRRGAGIPTPAPADVPLGRSRTAEDNAPSTHTPAHAAPAVDARTGYRDEALIDEADHFAAEHRAARLHGIEAHADTEQPWQHEAAASIAPDSGLGFVIPGLVPDEEDDAIFRPGRDWEPETGAAYHAPVYTPAPVAPSFPQRDVPAEPAWAPQAGWEPEPPAATPEPAWAPTPPPAGAPSLMSRGNRPESAMPARQPSVPREEPPAPPAFPAAVAALAAPEAFSAPAPAAAAPAPAVYEPHLDEARAWGAGEQVVPAAPFTPPAPPAHVAPSWQAPEAAPAPAAYAAPAPSVAPVDESAPWAPAPAPTGFPTFASQSDVPAGYGVPPAAAPVPTSAPAPAWPVSTPPAPVEPSFPVGQPQEVSWQSPQVAAQPAFQDLVGDVAPTSEPKRRWSLFGRKKDEHPTAAPTAPVERALPVAPAPQAAMPQRASAFGSAAFGQAAPATPPAPAAPAVFEPQNGYAGAGQNGSTGFGFRSPAVDHQGPPAFRAPTPPAPVFAPAPQAPAAPAFEPAPTFPSGATTSWSPPAPSGDGHAGGGAFGSSRVGALDDEVAAMLALRSDIQEQALAELSQLSAYRPTAVSGTSTSNGSLTRRVPTAIPEAPEFAPAGEKPVSRDANQLRSRLSSFQSGTSRGRRAVDGASASPSDSVSQSETSPVSSTQDSSIPDDHDNTPSAPSW